MINRGGQKVAPAEVEEALLSHPEVVEAAVFPISHMRLGEDVAAVVVLRPGAKVSVQSVREFASERLATFKVPGLIRIVPEIPKGPGGKINRGGLARRAFNNAAKYIEPNAAADRLRPVRNWRGNWPRPGRISWSSTRSAWTRMSSRSARTPLR